MGRSSQSQPLLICLALPIVCTSGRLFDREWSRGHERHSKAQSTPIRDPRTASCPWPATDDDGADVLVDPESDGVVLRRSGSVDGGQTAEALAAEVVELG